MPAKITFFILGLLVGAGAAAALFVLRFQPPEIARERGPWPAEAGGVSHQVAELDGQLATVTTRNKNLEADNLKLATRVQELMKQTAGAAKTGSGKPANPLVAMFGDGDSESGKAMQGMMKAALEQQLEGKLALMNSKLKLSPDQENSAREILGKMYGRGRDLAAKMMKGELSADEAGKGAQETANPEAELKALLTPEQQPLYEKMQQEERANNARLVANSELLQMQNTLGLDQAQQDKVFTALYEQAQSQMGSTGQDSAPAANLEGMMQRKIEAMKGVLTDEQFERYRKFQEQQMKMIQAFLPKDGKPGAGLLPQVQIITSP